MNNVPLYLPLGFVATVLLTCYFLIKAAHGNRILASLLIIWMVGQSVVAITGFYTNMQTIPPRFMAMLLPPVTLILIMFATRKGQNFIDLLRPDQLSLLHIVRVPVEFCLFALYSYQLVPQLMTFEGINFDIISGITAPLIAYFGYHKKVLSKTVLLIWNLICLGLLVNIAFHGILSVPSPFQRFGFEQPNIGLTYFPYIFLPGLIVPAVLFAHLSSIRQLLKS
ncbi:MAG: hypothetical protein ACO1NK_11130 [Sediminibacterium sp.]